MDTTTQAAAGSFEINAHKPAKGRFWAGWVLTGLTTIFMLLDATMHLMMPAPVVEAFKKLDLPLRISPTLGIILLIATILYVVPRTAVLGAVLLTGYFGGAVLTHLRAGSSSFEMVFPVIAGAIAWAGIYLREPRLKAIQ